MHSRDIADYGGVVNTMPRFATFLVFFAMANAGLAGTSGLLASSWSSSAPVPGHFWYAFLAATTLDRRCGLHAVDGTR